VSTTQYAAAAVILAASLLALVPREIRTFRAAPVEVPLRPHQTADAH
jgi:hypothetical protein